jgi:hypothetical protein
VAFEVAADTCASRTSSAEAARTSGANNMIARIKDSNGIGIRSVC